MVMVMLDFLDGGKVMLLVSHRREEKVCRKSPSSRFVLGIGVVYLGNRDGDTYDRAWVDSLEVLCIRIFLKSHVQFQIQ